MAIDSYQKTSISLRRWLICKRRHSTRNRSEMQHKPMQELLLLLERQAVVGKASFWRVAVIVVVKTEITNAYNLLLDSFVSNVGK